jgi:hypothetical protein
MNQQTPALDQPSAAIAERKGLWQAQFGQRDVYFLLLFPHRY